jgi:tRNA(Ile2)-agmatinylcytidine synthase
VTVIGVDDTDSRERGMCTTYVAARIAERVRAAGGTVTRLLLVRLDPAVEHKTRGNAALAVHCDLNADRALGLASEALDHAETADPQTNPGVVVAGTDPLDREALAGVARRAVREYVRPAAVRRTLDRAGVATAERGTGRGLVGAAAAVGAWQAFEEWTYEAISYREPGRWGTDREVDRESVFRAAEAGYPEVWDTVDREEDVAVCVPRTPCPVLYGIRGETPGAVREVATAIESESVAGRQVFVTNQGTDAHLRRAGDEVRDGRAYRLDGRVATAPETRQGGHVFVGLATDAGRLQCVAFEPTKRFRDRVRGLRPGDRLTVCGEVSDGTLKLEKFAVRDLVETELATPDCPACGRSMESAGREAGYRCRDCSTTAPGKVERELDRCLEGGWYEVPPCARRHVAKPLVRGGFDAPVHPER